MATDVGGSMQRIWEASALYCHGDDQGYSDSRNLYHGAQRIASIPDSIISSSNSKGLVLRLSYILENSRDMFNVPFLLGGDSIENYGIQLQVWQCF